MKLQTLVRWLDRTLQNDEFEDASVNGLQFEGRSSVRRVAFAVDACRQSFRAAVELEADLLVVHHGILWKGLPPKPIRGALKAQLGVLVESDLSLYAAHLPLDAHPRLGNNAELCRLLGLRSRAPWGLYDGKTIGFRGELARATRLEAIARKLGNALGSPAQPLGPSDRKVRRIGVISGGAGSSVEEAAGLGLDLFVLGEIRQHEAVLARELDLAVLVGGHYATETVGLKALARELARRHGLKCDFIDLPTGI